MKTNVLKMALFHMLKIFAALTFAAGTAFAGVKDGGGGNFTLPVFWKKVSDEIIPALKKLKNNKSQLLSANQVDELISKMNKTATTVNLVDTPLYIVKAGKTLPVDAKNYPDQRLIELYKSPWQYLVNLGIDVNHLILHEFMGLARISDQNDLSIKILPPSKSVIQFGSTKLNCETTVKYIMIKGNSFYVRDMDSQSTSAVLPPEVRLDPQPECGTSDPKTGACIQYAKDYRVKTTKVKMPIHLDNGDTTDGTYTVEGTVNLLSSYYGYGWGAARNSLFLRKPQLQVVWKLVHVDSSGQQRTESILNQETEQTNDMSQDTTLGHDIPVPAFLETIERNGFQLGIHPYKGEVAAPFHSYNIVGFVEDTAIKAGMKTGQQIDQFAINTLFKGIKGNALPFRIHAQCKLLAP